MKIQNLSIIFVIILVPIIMVLSFYIEQQTDTLELQEKYNTKIITASKNAIKAFEINTVDWKSTEGKSRTNAQMMVNTFTTSLANELALAGTAREYMLNYIPAIAINMYDGYYMYAPTYTPKTITNPDGVQLFLDIDDGKISTDTSGKMLYKPKSGVTGTTGHTYEYIDDETTTITIQADEYVTDITQADTTYKHALSNKIGYTSRYQNGTFNAVINYTLDNRIYVYATEGTNFYEKDGYLVYFDYNKTQLPRIIINDVTDKKESDITVKTRVDEAVYATELSNGAINEVPIETEILTEQIVYKDDADNYSLGTFKYVYDITHTKLYYDDAQQQFFMYDTKNKKRNFLNYTDNTAIRWKSVSVLVGDGKTTEFKKIYQALNGNSDMVGHWFINLNTDDKDTVENESLETEITNIASMGLLKVDSFSAIYRDYSAISYYVEAYAFTNWIQSKLGGTITQQRMEYKLNPTTNNYEYVYDTEDRTGIFDISKTNNPENASSAFVAHRNTVIKDTINENLNLAISNYNDGGIYNFQLPVLTDNDWETMLENVSILAFVQGIPIGTKYYNNYAIATSKTNREYVDPDAIYLSGVDQKYHLPYCYKSLNGKYTGYRSAEYILKQFSDSTVDYSVQYYEHDEQINNNSELACYYCLVNRQNYKAIENGTGDTETDEKIYYQVKAYNEALARERYEQKEKVEAQLFKDIPISVTTQQLELSNTNLIFIVDNSKSMENNERLESLKKAVRNIFSIMGDGNADNFFVGAINFNTEAHELGKATSSTELQNIITKIGQLNPEGDTYYSAAFKSATNMINTTADWWGDNIHRAVIFLTDGIPYLDTSADEYKEAAMEMVKEGVIDEVYLIGFDLDTDTEKTLQELADYIHDERPAVDTEMISADTTNVEQKFRDILQKIIPGTTTIETSVDRRLILKNAVVASNKEILIRVTKSNGSTTTQVGRFTIKSLPDAYGIVLTEDTSIYISLEALAEACGLSDLNDVNVSVSYFTN